MARLRRSSISLLVTVGAAAGFLAGLVTTPTAASAATCTIYWTGAASSDWQDAANWSRTDGGRRFRVPGANDFVCMSTNPVRSQVVASAIDRTISGIDFVAPAQVAAQVAGDRSLEIQGGTFTIGRADSRIETLILDGGTLTGAAPLLVTAQLALPQQAVTIAGGTKTVGPNSTFVQAAPLTLGTSAANGGTDLVVNGTWTGARTRVRLASVPSGTASRLITNGASTLSPGALFTDVGGRPVRGSWLNAGATSAPGGAGVSVAMSNAGSFTTADTVLLLRGNAGTPDTGTWITSGDGEFILTASRSLTAGSVAGPGGFDLAGGTTTLASGVDASQLTVEQDATLAGAPEVSDLALAGGTLTGPGVIGAQDVFGCDADLVAGATLRVGGSMTLADCSLLLAGGSTLDNLGSLAVSGTGCCGALSSDGDAANALVNEAGGTITANMRGRRAEFDVPVRFLNNGGTVRAIAGTLAFTDRVSNLDAGGTLTAGTWVADGGTIALPRSITSNNASIVLTGDRAFDPSLDSLAANLGSLTLADVDLALVATTLTNSGTVHLADRGRIFANAYVQTAGTTTIDGGGVAVSDTEYLGGSVTGTGPLGGAVVADALIAPDTDGDGVLGFTDSLDLQPGNTISIVAGRSSLAYFAPAKRGTATPAVDHGEAHLDGTLDITTPVGSAPSLGDTAVVLTAASITGTFSTITGADVPGVNGYWAVDYDVPHFGMRQVVLTLTPYPTVTVRNAVTTEGDTGTKPMSFTIELSAPSSVPVHVDYATADGTAQAPNDYLATSGTAVIAAGASSTVVQVQIVGDTNSEGNERFSLVLSNPSKATLGVPSTGRGVIRNDDAA